jgi:thymidylate synthase
MIQGEYGRRNAANIRANGPSPWILETWTAPKALPPVIDEPEEFVPPSLQQADLLLCFQEDGRAAQLIPEVARRSDARAVIAAIDREEWLPRGLANQLARWFQDHDLPAVFPKPLCSLTEESYGLRDRACRYRSDLISEFARHFGRPCFQIWCDAPAGSIRSVKVTRDSVCGCARSVAAQLTGVRVQDAGETAGLAHHHHPCMASMGIDPDFNDTLMHVAGAILKDAVRDALASPVEYVTPDGRIKGSP